MVKHYRCAFWFLARCYYKWGANLNQNFEVGVKKRQEKYLSMQVLLLIDIYYLSDFDFAFT